MPELAKLTATFSMNYSMIVDTDNGTSGRSAVAVDYLMDYFFRLRDQPNGHVSAVLGPTFSSVAKPTALMASAEQVPMLSYYASSPELSNSVTYPFFTRTYPSDDTAAPLLTRVLYDDSVFTGWNHVAVVYRDDAFGQGYVTRMKREFEAWANENSNGRKQSLPPAFTEDDVHAYHTLLSFPFTESGDDESIKRALGSVKSSGYSIIVLVGVGRSLPNLLEASRAAFVLRIAPLPPPPMPPRLHRHARALPAPSPVSHPTLLACVSTPTPSLYVRYRRRTVSLWLRHSMRGSSSRGLDEILSKNCRTSSGGSAWAPLLRTDPIPTSPCTPSYP